MNEEEVIGEDGVRCIRDFMQREVKTLFNVDMNVSKPLMDGDQLIDYALCQSLTESEERRLRRRKRKVYNFDVSPNRKWEMPIYFAFTKNFDNAPQDKAMIRNVLSHVEVNTCIRFEEFDPVTQPKDEI
jgi:hypothetical protein